MIHKFISNVVIVTCLSFTIMMLYITLLPKELVPDLQQLVIIQTLSICFVAGFFATILQKINFKHVMTSVGVTYTTIWMVVFGMGTLFYQLIPFEFPIIFSVSITIFVIYVACLFVFYKKNQVDADRINELLQQQGEHE